MAGVDLRELFEDAEERMRAAFDGMIHEVYFALPVSVVEDSDGKTAKLQPMIKGKFTDVIEGGHEYVNMPTIDTAPVHFTGGGADDKGKGGFTMTHPIKKGDEGMVIFSSRAIDNWFHKGGIQEPVDARYHHLADGKFIPGLRSKPRELKNVSTKTVQLRSDDEGDDKKPKHLIDIDHSGGTITTSIDSGKHVTTVDKEKGIKHKSTMNVTVAVGDKDGNDDHSIAIDKSGGITHTSKQKITINAPQLVSKGDWSHDGKIVASGLVSGSPVTGDIA